VSKQGTRVYTILLMNTGMSCRNEHLLTNLCSCSW